MVTIHAYWLSTPLAGKPSPVLQESCGCAPYEQQSSNAWVIESPIAAMLLGSGGFAAVASAMGIINPIKTTRHPPRVIQNHGFPCPGVVASNLSRLLALIILNSDLTRMSEGVVTPLA